jgi:hypothetical protein
LQSRDLGGSTSLPQASDAVTPALGRREKRKRSPESGEPTITPPPPFTLHNPTFSQSHLLGSKEAISNPHNQQVRVLRVLKDPDIDIQVPRGSISEQAIPSILMKVAAMAADAVRKEEIIESPRSEFENGFRKGIGAALIMCTFPCWDPLADVDIVESHPDCPPLIKETLGRMAGYTGEPVKTNDKHVWDRPTFISANDYIHNLDPENRVLSIGNIDGEPVMAVLVGHMDVQDEAEDDTFYGRCEILIREKPDEFHGYGFILGSIAATGTAIIVDYRNRLYAYSPENAVDRPWKHMISPAAALTMDADHNITLRAIPKMMVKCVGS